MFKKIISLSLIALMLFSILGNVSAFAGEVHTIIGTNGWAASSIEIWDQTGGYYDKHNTPGARRTYKSDFIIPDKCKWHNLVVKFNHGVAGQGPSDYVTIASYTGGNASVYFETYGDDVEASYKGLHKKWNDKHENHFWLG